MDLLPQSVMCVCVWGDNTRDLGAQTLHTQPCHVCRWARLSQCLSQHWLFFFKSMFSRSSCSAFRTHNSSSLLILSHSGSCVQQLRQKFNADSLFTCILHSLSCTQTGNTLSNCLLRSVDSEMQEEVQMKLFFCFTLLEKAAEHLKVLPTHVERLSQRLRRSLCFYFGKVPNEQRHSLQHAWSLGSRGV